MANCPTCKGTGKQNLTVKTFGADNETQSDINCVVCEGSGVVESSVRKQVLKALAEVEEEESQCESSPSGSCEPDWNSVYNCHDGGELYIDVNCKHCGKSGCIGSEKTLLELISWD
jgi:hypothetical protein